MSKWIDRHSGGGVNARPVVEVASVEPHYVVSGPSKGVRKLVHVPEVYEPDGSFDRVTMREFLAVAFGPEVAETARWCSHANAPRTDVMTIAVLDWLVDPRPGWLVDRRIIEERLAATGMPRVRDTYAVTVSGRVVTPRVHYPVAAVRRGSANTPACPFVEIVMALPSSDTAESAEDRFRQMLGCALDAGLAEQALPGPRRSPAGTRCFLVHRWCTAAEALHATNGLESTHAPNGHGFNRWVALHGAGRGLTGAATIESIKLAPWTSTSPGTAEPLREPAHDRQDLRVAGRAPREEPAPGPSPRRTA